MAKKDNYFPVTDPGSGGVNTKDDSRDLATNESPYILNMDIGKKGRVISRRGYEQWGDAISGVNSGFRGLLTFYRTHTSNQGDYLLSFNADGNAYESTNTTPTPASIGAYGTDSGAVRGIVFNNSAIFGNGLAANAVKSYDGGGSIASLGGSPQDSKIFGIINKMLVLSPTASPHAVYWSDVLDETDWSGGIASNTGVPVRDGGDIRAIIEANDQPMILAEYSKHLCDVSFDASDIATRLAFKEKVDISGGCAATGSVQNMLNSQGEVVMYLGYKGFQTYGALADFSDKRNPSEVSYKINPTVRQINFAQHDVINSAYHEEKYLCLAPFQTSLRNNYGFVFNQEFGGWTLYNNMNFADITVFRDADRRNQLIAASNLEAKLFKFNNSFSDDGVGYERVYRSRTWTFGNRVRWGWIDIEGSKSLGKDIYIDVYVDGVKTTEKITNDHLIQSIGGGYIGDNWLGDAYLGGAGNLGESPLYNFKARFKFKTRREGQEMYFDLRNNSDGGGWSLKQYGIKIDPVSAEVAKNPLSGESAYTQPIV